MKKTLIQTSNAEAALQGFLEASLPPKKAWSLYQLSKLLNEQNEFYINEQRKILIKYDGEPQPNGYVKFSSPEVSLQAQTDLNELSQLEVELNVTPITLTENDTQDIRISMQQAAALDGFVIFE